MIRSLFAITLLLSPCFAYAHAFDERYDLPIPLNFFISGAVLIVAFTYLVAILFVREGKSLEGLIGYSNQPKRILFHLSPRGQRFIGNIAILGLAMLILVAFCGPKNPLMNMSSHFIWVNWWVGVPLLFAVFGSVMYCIDPFEAIDRLLMKTSASAVARPMANVMARIGKWPAVMGLLIWCWIEVVYPNAALPYYLGMLICLWLISGLIGRWLLGSKVWNESWDFFRIYFSYFAQLSPFALINGSVIIGKPFIGLIQESRNAPGNIAFVIAMLSTVLFDGLHSSPAWLVFQKLFAGHFDNNGYFLGVLGVILVWAFFYVIFIGTCLLVPRNARIRASSLRSTSRMADALYIAQMYAPSLIPIALAYLIAHNFSSLIIQGQNFFILISDPLGRNWNLFGTANWYPNISILDAKTVWYIALCSIVIGHVLSIFLAHLVSLREFKDPKIACTASLPLTVLMILFTAVSLLILAEPLVNSA